MFINSTRAFVDVGTFEGDNGICSFDIGRGDLISLWPAHQLEELASLGRGLHAGHQLGQGHDLKSVSSSLAALTTSSTSGTTGIFDAAAPGLRGRR